MAIETAHFRMSDRLAGGRLREVLAEHRREGRSFDEISRRLYADYGIEVSRPTIVGWAEDLGIGDEPTPTEAAL